MDLRKGKNGTLAAKLLSSTLFLFALFTLLLAAGLTARFHRYLSEDAKENQAALFHRELRGMSIMLGRNDYAGESALVRDNAVVWAMRRHFSGEYALYREGEELYNGSAYNYAIPEDVRSGLLQTRSCRVGGRNLLVLYMGESFCGTDYVIVKAVDVTAVFVRERKLLLWSLGVIVLSCALGGLVLYFVLKATLEPLRRLAALSDEFAEGNYRGRAPVQGADEMVRLGAAFNRMAGRIEEKIGQLTEMNERQIAMTGSIAHELKTPLTAMLGYSVSLRRMNLSEAQRDKALTYIEKESRRLSSLSEKILELTCLEMGGGEEQGGCCRLSEAIAAARESLEVMLSEKKITLSCADSPGADGPDIAFPADFDLSVSLVRNLLENAAKASPPGGRVEIGIDVDAAARTACFFLRDYGAGIPQEELGRVMEPFYMVDKSRSRRQGGAGLGLALCRAIAERYGLRLTIDSASGGGTTVQVAWET